MGWGWATPDKATKLLKCAEFIATCGQPETDGCCAVIACSYCLEWEMYGADIVYGTVTFGTTSWTGTIAGAAFAAYWERNYDTDECEFVVTLDGEEVYRKSCYAGQDCRDSSDSVETTIDYDDGTLRWTRIEPRPLEYVVDYETNCRTHFCGGCECSCDCLCVTITDSYAEVTTGEICDTAYECDGPVWAGTVGDYELSLALGQDIYGECTITPTVNGVELDAVAASGCGAMSALITLDGGTTIAVVCKVCGCDQSQPCASCCDGNYPQTTLYATFTLLNSTPRCACLDGLTIALEYLGTTTNELDECEAVWRGRGARPCPAGGEFDIFFYCRSSLDSPGTSEIQIYLDDGVGTAQTDYLSDGFDYYASSCDPFEFCIRSNGAFPVGVQECADASVDETAPEIEICITQ